MKKAIKVLAFDETGIMTIHWLMASEANILLKIMRENKRMVAEYHMITEDEYNLKFNS